MTVALVDVLGGTDVKCVLVGGMRFVAHQSARAVSEPPGLWAGSNPPLETSLRPGPEAEVDDPAGVDLVLGEQELAAVLLVERNAAGLELREDVPLCVVAQLDRARAGADDVEAR